MAWVFGIMLVVALWSMLVGWLAKVARANAYSTLWALAGGLLGAAGFAAGTLVLRAVFERSDDGAIALLALMLLAPLVLMIAIMIGFAKLLQSGAIGGLRPGKWAVHILTRGPGTLRVERDRVIFEWPDGSRELALAQLQGVHADGECVRVRADDEIVVMPLDDSLSPEGRRRVSAQITQRLRVALPVAVVRASHARSAGPG